MATRTPWTNAKLSEFRKLYKSAGRHDEKAKRERQLADNDRWLCAEIASVCEGLGTDIRRQFAEATGVSDQVVYQYMRVWKLYGNASARHKELSFDSHLKLAQMSEVKRGPTASEAIDSGVSVETVVKNNVNRKKQVRAMVGISRGQTSLSTDPAFEVARKRAGFATGVCKSFSDAFIEAITKKDKLLSKVSAQLLIDEAYRAIDQISRGIEAGEDYIESKKPKAA